MIYYKVEFSPNREATATPVATTKLADDGFILTGVPLSGFYRTVIVRPGHTTIYRTYTAIPQAGVIAVGTGYHQFTWKENVVVCC